MSEAAGKINTYTCRVCAARIVTINRVEGTTPFMLNCRVKPGCKGVMQSGFYRGDQSETPTHEWFRPSIKAARRQGPDMVDHVRKGGLDIRPIVTKGSTPNALTVGVGWDSYMARVVPPGAPPEQIQECRRAFYAGAANVVGILDAIASDEITEDSGIAILERVHQELRAYVATVGTSAERV